MRLWVVAMRPAAAHLPAPVSSFYVGAKPSLDSYGANADFYEVMEIVTAPHGEDAYTRGFADGWAKSQPTNLPPEADAEPDEAFDLGWIAGYDAAMAEVSQASEEGAV